MWSRWSRKGRRSFGNRYTLEEARLSSSQHGFAAWSIKLISMGAFFCGDKITLYFSMHTVLSYSPESIAPAYCAMTIE